MTARQIAAVNAALAAERKVVADFDEFRDENKQAPRPKTDARRRGVCAAGGKGQGRGRGKQGCLGMPNSPIRYQLPRAPGCDTIDAMPMRKRDGCDLRREYR